MIRLFVNGLAASAGGGLTYLRNVIPEFARHGDAEITVLLNPALRKEFGDPPNVSFVDAAGSSGSISRLFREQIELPKMIRRSGAQVLLSTGNFALWKSPVPQILLSRNALYTSNDFLRDVRDRGDYRIWADTLVKGCLAKQSISRADATVAPSQAFAAELTRWSGREVIAIHHGFDANAFTSDATPLPAEAQALLAEGADALRLLFVSHYNYYRNFETLLRAIPLLKRQLKHENVKLYLTCHLNSRDNPGNYRAESASSLLRELRASGEVVQLGSIPYRSLHHLYRACHIYVTPAYAESFAHPLIEAMSMGLPVVAAGLPVHREICGGAALYFPAFSQEALAHSVFRIHQSPELKSELSQKGLSRALDFSWRKHVEQLLELARRLMTAR